MRLTATAPEALRDACNHLAMCLAYGPADGLTYGEPKWQDADGNLYAAASFVARDEWIQGASSPMQRPAWDTGNLIDMDAAGMKNLAFELGSHIDDLFFIGGSETNGKPVISVYISKSLVEQKGLNAGNIVRELGKFIQGGGGGQPFFATAGGKNPAGLKEALAASKSYLN